MIQQTLVLIKPDGLARHLVGTIFQTFEDAELSVVHLATVRPTRNQVLLHYPDDITWLETAGSRAIKALRESGLDYVELTGLTTAQEVGLLIRERLVDYLCSGQVIVAVLDGNGALAKVRQLVGATLPHHADPASIRGRYCSDDVARSFTERRALHNLLHASGSADEFQRERHIWL